jgi:ribokinase
VGVLLLQNEIPEAASAAALRLARGCERGGPVVVFNPAPASRPLAESELLLADILAPNEVELALLTGLPTDSDQEVEMAARRLLFQSDAVARRHKQPGDGCRVVLVTLGARGAMLVAAGSTFGSALLLPAASVAATDTTGYLLLMPMLSCLSCFAFSFNQPMQLFDSNEATSVCNHWFHAPLIPCFSLQMHPSSI